MRYFTHLDLAQSLECMMSFPLLFHCSIEFAVITSSTGVTCQFINGLCTKEYDFSICLCIPLLTADVVNL